MITYAQNFEDVMLARLFAGQREGFYVDIGAGHPTLLSVTRHFYELGWRGINVEPIRNNWELFRRDRPRDTNLNVAVSSRPERRAFCEVLDDDALSTLDSQRIAALEASGALTVRYEVECVTGDSILAQAPGEIDFLKVDVEGAEEDVLRSIDFRRFRPKVLVIEAVAPMAQFPGWESFAPEALARWQAWEPLLLESGYVLAHFDGLNRLYLREDLRHLASRLALPPGVFDFILADLNAEYERRYASQHKLLRALEEKEAAIQQLRQAASASDAALREASVALQQREGALRSLDDKEAVIRELAAAVDSYRRAFGIFAFVARPVAFGLRPLRRPADAVRAAFTPRLGNLHQHGPRALMAPAGPSRKVALERPPRIAIVTPSYNQGAFIERTIRSVLDQGYPNLEYHVQDGASTDGTREILERHADRLASWESAPDGGQTQALNRAFARTSGDLMAWLNSDDILLPGALAEIAEYFDRHPEVDVVYGQRLLIDEHDRQIGRWILPAHDGEVLSWADYVPQETLFWRRRIWDRVGGRLDESFRFAMDWDLLVRFRDAGARFALLPRFVGGFRIHPQQKTSAFITDVGFKEMDRIRERALGRVPSAVEVRKAVVPFLLRHLVADYRWRIGWMLKKG